MATDDIERLHYYQRQYLGALDFEAQQTYHRDMRRRLNLAQHTWGIVTGLELQSVTNTTTNTTDISITPGMAIDGYGREIVVFMPQQLDPAKFRFFRDVNYHTVCIEYAEALTQSPQAGYGQCDQTNQFGRVGENFNVVVEDPFRDPIMIGGEAAQLLPGIATAATNAADRPILPLASSPAPASNSPGIPQDESVPYQELPVDDPALPSIARWLIPLGRVYWTGTPGKQQFGGDEHAVIIEDGRHYVGNIAAQILAPAQNLVVRDRNTNAPLPPPADPATSDGVAMIIEGTLQVDHLLNAQDDIQIHRGALDFRSGSDTSQADDKKLFTVSRNDSGGAGGTDLQLKIGADKLGKNRFVVGTTDTHNLFSVDDTGNVYPTGTLDFGDTPRQMIILWSQDKSQQNGFGIQALPTHSSSATTYFRSSNDFYWYSGGIHSDKPGDAGNAGTILMSLNNSGDLTVSRTLSIKGSLTVNGMLHANGGLTVNGILNANSGLTVNGILNANGGLTVNGPTLSFLSTTNPGFFVSLGQIVSPHGSDSIYGSPNLWLDAAGSVYIKKGARILSTDGAAFFPPNAIHPPQPGDVVVINTDGTAIPATAPEDTSVIGVVSSDPGFIFQSQYPLEGTPVALMGTVKCNVDNTSSATAIEVGDLLTTSLHPGYAQRAHALTHRGAVFGKALEPMLQGTLGTITILLMSS